MSSEVTFQYSTLYMTGKFRSKRNIGSMARVKFQRTGQEREQEEALMLENVSAAVKWSSNFA
jgi:hypothetical protein